MEAGENRVQTTPENQRLEPEESFFKKGSALKRNHP